MVYRNLRIRSVLLIFLLIYFTFFLIASYSLSCLRSKSENVKSGCLSLTVMARNDWHVSNILKEYDRMIVNHLKDGWQLLTIICTKLITITTFVLYKLMRIETTYLNYLEWNGWHWLIKNVWQIFIFIRGVINSFFLLGSFRW